MNEIEPKVNWGWALFQETIYGYRIYQYIWLHIVIHIMFHTIGYKEHKRNSGVLGLKLK